MLWVFLSRFVTGETKIGSSFARARSVSASHIFCTPTLLTNFLVLGKEKNILAEIKRLKKPIKPKLEKSFHEDRPREAALKQKEKMARLHTSTTKASSSKGEKVCSTISLKPNYLCLFP